ncbi:MAG: four helix bundle protein [Dissulfurispiraceae bacterium]|nr:four helix bundle protein [Dissulfurispiraceae bacterium]
MKKHNFRNLKIYKKGIIFSVNIYKISKSFPKDELFGLTSQLRRAAMSITLNIAEGSGNRSVKEFKRFLEIALRSTYEVMAGLEIAYHLEYCKIDDFNKLTSEADEIAAMIVGFAKSLKP